MPARPKVVDASAVAALLFAEPRAADIAARLHDAPLVAPALLPFEVSSVCLKKLRLYPDRRDALLEGLSLLGSMAIRLSGVPAPEMVGLAEAESVTPNDAAYLWLARTLECDLVTLDRQLERAFARRPSALRRGTPRRT
jgi:predicted nucleic acid-binding protein